MTIETKYNQKGHALFEHIHAWQAFRESYCCAFSFLRNPRMFGTN
jgi:hypothetical protein